MHPLQKFQEEPDALKDFLSPRNSNSTVENITPIQGGDPNYLIQNEKTVHRLMCYRSASGDSPQEIADATGFTVQHVRTILKQPRSQELIAKIIHEKYGDDVSSILKGGSVDAVMEIRRLSKEAQSETVRLNAAKDILDRCLGKAPQKIETGPSKVPLDPAEEAEMLEKELQQLEK